MAFCLGCILAMYRARLSADRRALDHNRSDWWLLGILLLALGLTGFWWKRCACITPRCSRQMAHWSIVGWLIDVTVLRGLDVPTAQTMHLGASGLAARDSGRRCSSPRFRSIGSLASSSLVRSTSPLRPERPDGRSSVPLTMEEVERTGRTGVG